MPERIDAAKVKLELASVRHVLRSVGVIALVCALVPAGILAVATDVSLMVIHSISALVAAGCVVLFVVFLPSERFVTPHSSRVAAAVLGLVSVCLAWVAGLSLRGREGEWQGWMHAVSLWLVASVFALVILLIASFVFEMARKDRKRLIESIGTTVSSGAIAWCAGGWVFFGEAMRATHGASRYVVLAIIIVFALLLGAALPWGTEVDVSASLLNEAAVETDTEKTSAEGTSAAKTSVTAAGAKETSSSDIAAGNVVTGNKQSATTGACRRVLYSLGTIPVLLSGAVVALSLLVVLHIF